MIARALVSVAALSLILPVSTYATQLNFQESQPQDNLQTVQIFSQRGRSKTSKKFREKLDLTDEQATQVEAIQTRYRATNEKSYQELRKAREELRSLLTNNANPNQLRQKHLIVQSLQQKIGNNYFEAILAVREILTPEQRQKMAEMMAQQEG